METEARDLILYILDADRRQLAHGEILAGVERRLRDIAAAQGEQIVVEGGMTPDEAHEAAEQIVIDYNTQAVPGWILRDYIARALLDVVAAQRERDARLLETRCVVFGPGGRQMVVDDEPDVIRRMYAAAIRAQS